MINFAKKIIPLADSNRVQKVAHLFQQELAESVRKKVAEKTTKAVVSISELRITSDLSLARAFVSVFPDVMSEEVFEWIVENEAFFKNQLAKGPARKMRLMPELNFRLDHSQERMEQINKALRGEGENPII